MELINRELSIIEFNKRLLAQAQNIKLPLLERLKYLCILSSNLDEFFETRYANIVLRLEQDKNTIDDCGLPLLQIRDSIHCEISKLVEAQYICYYTITTELSTHGISFHQSFDWNDEQKKWAKDFFINHILPVLMPITLDPAHPFPKVLNKSLNFAITIDGQDVYKRKPELIILPAPRSLPRFVHMPEQISGSKYTYVFLSSFIQAFTSLLFPDLNIKGCYQFRLTRNSDVFINNDLNNVLDLRIELEGHLSTRNLQDAMRLEVAYKMPSEIIAKLLQTQEENIINDILDPININETIYWYRVDGPVNLVRLLPLIDDLKIPSLKFNPYIPKYPKALKNVNWFNELKKNDVLIHLPYESFDTLLDFLNQASQDKNVVSIQMTLYRTGKESPIVKALINAAQQGKEVTVIVELLARFDEETNIYSSSELERYGVHVVYGVVGYKCHAKLLLITRSEYDENGWHLAHYTQIGTGNYHAKTAKFYTDFCFFTSNSLICQDIHQTIRSITGSASSIKHNNILQSPFNLHESLLNLIQQEYSNNSDNLNSMTSKYKNGRIIIKVNSLDEPNIINALYKASQSGVKIILIVRGICAIRAKVKGLSENIEVISTIGKFLEHHRIFYFYAQGKEKLYIGSSDLMHRNCFKRIEVLVPIYSNALKKRIMQEGLNPHIKYSAWHMEPNNEYKIHNSNKITPQEYLIEKYNT